MCRHLEVQIIGDEYGNAVALNGRDCSTQRRFQKIFEEGPPIVAPKDVFRQMELSAQRLTKSIGYVGAGTVEYLYNAASNKYYFLELNPRLQVEHPVTEGLTGVNLPSVQLQVAMGIALDRIPEIRAFFGRSPEGKDKIDFLTDEYVYPDKHIIAARITAENPDEGFKPTSGRIERVKFQSTPKVWGYFSVGANGGIHEFADSQFGHIFASGPTREDARKSLILALKEIDVRGDIRNPVDYLIKLLETPEFAANTIDTSWLDGIIREKAVKVQVEPHTVALSAAVYRAHSVVNTQMRELADALAKGQTSLQGISSLLAFPVEITFDSVKYVFAVSTQGPNSYLIKINGQEVEVRVREQPDKSLLCSIQGESVQLFGQDEALGLRMRINGATVMIPTVYNPSEMRSDVTGKIVRFLQQDGDVVEKDKPYVEVEAMKMIMAIKASESGVVSHALSPGSIISAGDLIANLQLKDPSKVKQISTFKERLSMIPMPVPLSAESAKEKISLAIDGYDHNIEEALKIYLKSATLEEAADLFAGLFQKFTAVESPFADSDEGTVVGTLSKSNKDNLMAIVPQLIAHKQVRSRSKCVLALLRAVEFFQETFSGYSNENVPEALRTALTALADLSNPALGEVSLKAKQLVDELLLPPFQTRLDALKALITKGADLVSLAKQPNIAVSVDLLVMLLEDGDAAIRKAAMEVYVRRVYRANCIKTLDIVDEEGVVSASWTFTIRDVEDSVAPLRYGFMQMLPSFLDQSADVQKVIDKASQHLKQGKYTEPLNVLHIGFSRYPDVGLDEIAKKTEAMLVSLKSQLAGLNTRGVNLLFVNPGKRVSYLNHFAETNYREDIISRNMRPAVPQVLEINRLVENHDLVRMPTVGRNSYLFFGSEKSDPLSKGKGERPQVLFLRSFSNSASTHSPDGSERVILMGLDELERAILDPRVSDTASARIFLNILPEVEATVEKCVGDFKRIMDAMVSKYATRLLKLRIDEIEVKIRIKDPKLGFVSIQLSYSVHLG
jgi:acetyl-CoA carboxylase/biotin carboxylase 1